MIHGLLKTLYQLGAGYSAKAHCDIPCKIYDPMTAQLAVLTMIRMVDLIEALPQQDLSREQQATLNRLIQQKETHGHQVKDEIRVIWGDYIKQPQLDTHPHLHELTHQIMLAASAAKQKVDRGACLHLLSLVNQFATIFWETKGVSVYQATCPYPPQETLVYPDLK